MTANAITGDTCWRHHARSEGILCGEDEGEGGDVHAGGELPPRAVRVEGDDGLLLLLLQAERFAVGDEPQAVRRLSALRMASRGAVLLLRSLGTAAGEEGLQRGRAAAANRAVQPLDIDQELHLYAHMVPHGAIRVLPLLFRGSLGLRHDGGLNGV